MVAVVVSSRNDVRYRPADDFVWNKSRNNHKIVNEDQFFIGEKSSLSIKTIDGETLQFSENSMVVIKLHGGKVAAELLLGEAQLISEPAAKGSGVARKMPARKKREPLKLALSEPEPEPAPKVEPVPEVKPEPVPEVKAEPPPVAAPPKPKLKWMTASGVQADVEQVTTREMLKGEANKVRISWQAENSTDPSRITIKDLQGRILKLMRTNENYVEWTGVRPGAYQVFVERYQVSTRKPAEIESGSNVFEVQPIKKIALGRPLFPEPNQTILRSPNGFSLPIQTKPTVDGMQTQVQFSRSKRFEQTEHSEIFDGHSYVLRERLPEGVWYIRTRTLGEYSISSWSEPLRIQILDQ